MNSPLHSSRPRFPESNFFTMASKLKNKTKTKTKQKHLKIEKQKRKLFRANEPLLSVFMWGINHTVTELSHVPPPVMLMPDDFKAYSKTKVDNHLFNKENMPSHFKVKEYCPNVFRNLRERFGIDEEEYMKSLTKYQPSSSESPGRSGSKFYLSYDRKFIVKTLLAEELIEIHSIFKHYHEYVVERHGRTLLPQYLGMYRLTVENSETYMIVMRNIFGRKYPIHKKFDLKGSTVQRQASEKEKAKDLPTYKDIDFLEDGCKLFLPDEARNKLLNMLESDVQFLTKLNLMDYSLLVGIHDATREAPPVDDGNDPELDILGTSPPGAGDSSEPDATSTGSDFQPTPPDSPVPISGAFGPMPNSENPELDLDDQFYAIASRSGAPKKEIYFIGLVDILTYYGVKKRTATAAKTVKYGAEAEISTVKPDQYARRLLEFISKSIE